MEFGNRNNVNNAASSDRLRKAIERNRAKVAKSSHQSMRQSKPPEGTSSLSERLAKLKETRKHSQSTRATGTSTASKFTRNQNRVEPTVASNIDILKARRQSFVSKPVRPKAKSPGIGEKLVEKNFSFFDRIFSTAIKALLAKTLRASIWLLNIAFLGIIVFGDRGVVDYISRHENLVQKQNKLSYLSQENEEIQFQIHRINNESTYQRQVIRDYLGYIAKDEYLVIFAQNQEDGVLPN